MKCEIEKSFHFEAAHFLPKVGPEHKCHKIHGHSYKVTIRLEGIINENEGWFMDLSDISDAFKPLLSQLDHRLLNEVPGLENPTSEMLAAWIIANLKPKLKYLSSVSISATPSVRVTMRVGEN